MSIVDDVRIHQDWGEDGYRFEIENTFYNPVFTESMEKMNVLMGASYGEIEQRIIHLLTTPTDARRAATLNIGSLVQGYWSWDDPEDDLGRPVLGDVVRGKLLSPEGDSV